MTSTKKGATSLPKLVAERIGRFFNLTFNRVTMYRLDHPTTQETTKQLSQLLQEGLQHISPLTIILDRENIFVEEELLDPRVNIQRLVSHMKNAGVQSVSFERGCTERDILAFARVFGDSKAFPTADDMKRGLLRQGLQKIRINHVFFKKMTADEEVVDKGEGPRGGIGGFTQVVIDTTAEGDRAHVAADVMGSQPFYGLPQFQNLFEDLTPSMLVENPSMVSQKLLEVGVSEQGSEGDPTKGGSVILHGIRQLRQRIGAVEAGLEGAGYKEDLLSAVFKFKEQVRGGLEMRRRQGEQVVGQDLIEKEMEDLTDQVMIQLVREEYQKGEITVKRLAQILRRMMPDVRELRRILPKLKEALLAEGMPLADYLQLIQELERELQSDQVAQSLEDGAEEIGVTVEELIREIQKDPGSVANLIVLAAEIRCLGKDQDQRLLSQILVDYVEKVGKSLAFERAKGQGAEGIKKLEQITTQIQNEILGQLQRRYEGSTLTGHVQAEIHKLQEKGQEELQQEFLVHQFMEGGQTLTDPKVLLQAIERAYSDASQQEQLLESVIRAMEERGLETGPLVEAFSKKARVAPGEADPKKVPRGTFNRTVILLFLREEVKRALRYGHVFSSLLISVKQARALKPIPIGMIRPHEIRNALMIQLAEHLRDVDLVGCLEENEIMVLLPFAEEDGASAVERKIIEQLDGKQLIVRNVPMQMTVAVVKEPFDKERTPNLKSLLDRMEKALSKLLKP
jgi:GGDEF domain-containing protein